MSLPKITAKDFVISSTSQGTQVEGPRVVLTAPTAIEVKQLWEKILGKQSIMQSFGPFTKTKEELLQDTAEKIKTGSPWHALMAYSTEDNSLIGFVDLNAKTEGKRKLVEMRIAVVEEKQKKGIGREIVHALRALALKVPTEHKPDFLCAQIPAKKTLPIAKLFEKNPFTVELSKLCTIAIKDF